MKKLNTDDPYLLRKHQIIDLPTIQRYINFWFSSSLDLFGSEISTNAALAFSNGLKGRPDEFKYDNHVEDDTYFEIEDLVNGKIKNKKIPTRNAMNEITRRSYIKDCEIGLKRWNRMIQKNGFEFTFSLPSEKFRRSIGIWSRKKFDIYGNIISKEKFEKNISSWIPSESDKDFIKGLMIQVTNPDKTASWISAPMRGINNMDINYNYVDLE